jgi:hypothetical protein
VSGRAPGLAGTRRGLRLAEGILSGCLWGLVGLAAAMGASVLHLLGWGSPWVGAAAVGLLGLWFVGAFARARRRRAAPVLESIPGERSLPTLWHPVRVPMATRTEGGVVRLWRVHGVKKPDGRMVTAEVGVEIDTGCPSFVVWPATRERPPAARGMRPVLEPVFGGLIVTAHDPSAVGARLVGLEQELREAVPDDGQLAVYPFGVWWRATGPATTERLARAEERSIALATALGSRGRG